MNHINLKLLFQRGGVGNSRAGGWGTSSLPHAKSVEMLRQASTVNNRDGSNFAVRGAKQAPNDGRKSTDVTETKTVLERVEVTGTDAKNTVAPEGTILQQKYLQFSRDPAR